MGMRRPLAIVFVTACVACGIDAVGTATGLASPGDAGGGGVERDDAAVAAADGAAPEEEEEAATDALADAAAEDTGSPLVPCSEPGGVRSPANHCYFPIAPTTQPAAQQACVAVGAHLVTENSLAEHSLLATVGAGDRWIGLSAAAPTNDRALYNWVTGEPKTVTYWYVNDPDNMGPCVALHGTLQEWVDRACGDTNPAICERE